MITQNLTIRTDRCAAPALPPTHGFNFSTRRVGGLRFVKLGRFCIAFCVTAECHPFKGGVTVNPQGLWLIAAVLASLALYVLVGVVAAQLAEIML